MSCLSMMLLISEALRATISSISSLLASSGTVLLFAQSLPCYLAASSRRWYSFDSSIALVGFSICDGCPDGGIFGIIRGGAG